MNKCMQVKNLEKIYGSKNNITHALNGVSFDVEVGEYVGIMGASGSGKTTLLNCVSTIDNATAGKIIINGKDITTLRPNKVADFRNKELGFIFQDYNLLDTLTAYENIALALTISKEKPSNIDEKVKQVAELLGITEVLKKYPAYMSGGQRQRVSAARAMVTNPSLILADEPTGALDSKSARALLECFQDMVQEMNSTILMVTHDPFSASYCDRILFIKDGKLFTEIRKGTSKRTSKRQDFFDQIIDVMAVLGGDVE